MNTTTRWPSVDRSPTPTGWARPANLMPADVPRSWPRGRRATSEAEEILATAEAWWDVDRSGYRDGDRYLRNIGTAGSALDLRLGSSGVANSNDPKWLGPQDTGYVYSPGIASNYLSVPDEAALRITGDIDVRARVSMDSWTSLTFQTFMGRRADFTVNYAWLFGMENASNRLHMWISSSGSARISDNYSTASPSFSPGVVKWVRATVDVDNGASGHTITYYTSDDGSTWTQLGAAIVNAGTASIYAANAKTTVGAYLDTGASSPLSGRIYRALVLSGINGTTVLDVDCDAITSGAATTFTATTGQTVTINRATSGRKSVAMPSRAKGGRPCMLLGTDDYLECLDAAQHGLLNFGQGDSFTVLAVVRMWANPSGIFHMLVAKGVSTNTGFPGWFLFRGNGTAAMRLQLNDTATAIGGAATQNIVNGTNSTVVGVRNLQGRVMGVSINGAVLTTINDTTSTGFVTNNQVRVGNRSSGSDFADMEFRAAAIFRRALTAREITVIANAAPWGV